MNSLDGLISWVYHWREKDYWEAIAIIQGRDDESSGEDGGK